jgi:hypothetical protein
VNIINVLILCFRPRFGSKTILGLKAFDKFSLNQINFNTGFIWPWYRVLHPIKKKTWIFISKIFQNLIQKLSIFSSNFLFLSVKNIKQISICDSMKSCTMIYIIRSLLPSLKSYKKKSLFFGEVKCFCMYILF